MLSLQQIVVRLTFAALLGATIGVEREVRRRPAGIRTSAFVCMGAALFTVLSVELARMFGDTSSTRIASNLVQGIGFLGAGAILREAGGLVGLTTAATIFVEAAIGMAAGAGLYAVAGYTTALVLFALVVLGWVAQVAHLKSRVMLFRVSASHVESIASEVQHLLEALKLKPQKFRVSMQGDTSIVEFEADTAHRQQVQLMETLDRPGVVTEVVPFQEHHE